MYSKLCKYKVNQDNLLYKFVGKRFLSYYFDVHPPALLEWTNNTPAKSLADPRDPFAPQTLFSQNCRDKSQNYIL